jgi:hypothetical protein
MVEGLKKVRSPHLGQHQRCPTLSIVKSIEGSQLQTSMVAIVVRELSIGQTLLPVRSVSQHTSSQNILKYLVYSICLSISLWVESRTVVQVGAHGLMQTPPELGSNLWPSVGYYALWCPM